MKAIFTAGLLACFGVWMVNAAEPAKPDAIVAADGSGQFKTVQEAINASPQSTSAQTPWVILVKPGDYRELVYVQREKRFVHLVGEDAATTCIAFDLIANRPGPDGKIISTFRTPTVQIDADDFTVEELTIANTAGAKGQALALRVDGDRVVFRGCRFLGWQDTILVNRGRQYFENCYIEGAVDFIFGGATAWFEHCEIRATGSGYITAASTPGGQAYGFVFSNCKITGAPEVKTYLGRPWRDYAQTVFIHTEMTDVIRPEGWHNWNKPAAEKTAHYGEFESHGPGAKPDARVPWSKQLSAEEAVQLTVERVLGGWHGNAPQPRG
jgi:pectinesterase